MLAITTDLITRDSASDQTDRVFAEDPASVQTSQVPTEDSGSDQTDRVSAEDPASVQTSQVPTEDSASKQTDQVPTEDSASDQTDRVSAEDPVSVQTSQVPTEDSASDPTDRVVSAGDSASHQVSSVFVTDSAHDWTDSNSADCSGSPPELDGDRTQDCYSGTPGPPVCRVAGEPAGMVHVQQEEILSSLVEISKPLQSAVSCHSLAVEQANDPVVRELMEFVQQGRLPQNDYRARKMALQQSLFTVVDGVPYFLDPKRQTCCRAEGRTAEDIGGNTLRTFWGSFLWAEDVQHDGEQLVVGTHVSRRCTICEGLPGVCSHLRCWEKSQAPASPHPSTTSLPDIGN